MNSKILFLVSLASIVVLSCFNDVEGFVDKRINIRRRTKMRKPKQMFMKELGMVRKTAKQMKLVKKYLQRELDSTSMNSYLKVSHDCVAYSFNDLGMLL